MQTYHLAWLANHPHRTEEWLAERLKDGFDVHHLDGDHTNDTPDNLILLEHTDHMFIHRGTFILGRLTPKRPRNIVKKPDPVSPLHKPRPDLYPEPRSGTPQERKARKVTEAKKEVPSASNQCLLADRDFLTQKRHLLKYSC